MKTIEIQLKATLAGLSSNPSFQFRETADRPLRSHIIGLIACCLGLSRDRLNELDSLEISIESMQKQTERLSDYHTVRDAVTNDGTPGRAAVTVREYIVDPSFIVNITGDDKLITKIEAAIKFPVWQPYLGRRSCVLSAPLATLKDGDTSDGDRGEKSSILENA